MMKSTFEQFEISPYLSMVTKYFDISVTTITMYLGCAIVIVIGIFSLMVHKATLIGNKWQNFGELFYEFFIDLLLVQIGKAGILFFPLIFAIFVFILILNLMGLVPLSFTITGQIMITFSLAIIILIGLTIFGFRIHGIKFVNLFIPSGLNPGLVPLLVCIEIMSYLLRPISLAVRLFANMLAGHILLHIIGGAAIVLFQYFYVGLLPWVCVCAFSLLELGIAFLQAYVFSILVVIYISNIIYLH
uniref:ATP synthase subunit a n=1 Tax=Cavenderia fasciculata TaxID=261658 RepID=B2XX88_CACFS|nr:ATPase subunit 6 [Cavenderia fasciculata]ABX45210.1 ATPase subunit 6 [Cavenderia fasciculata]